MTCVPLSLAGWRRMLMNDRRRRRSPNLLQRKSPQLAHLRSDGRRPRRPVTGRKSASRKAPSSIPIRGTGDGAAGPATVSATASTWRIDTRQPTGPVVSRQRAPPLSTWRDQTRSATTAPASATASTRPGHRPRRRSGRQAASPFVNPDSALHRDARGARCRRRAVPLDVPCRRVGKHFFCCRTKPLRVDVI
jgi:hypothetical protein